MKIAIITLGCRTNQAESFMLEQQLVSSGHQIVKLSDSPDICVLNTCTVTAKADQQSEHLIRTTLGKGIRVISTGCFSELHSEVLADKYSNLKIVSNSEKNSIINLIDTNYSGSKLTISTGSKHRPTLKVQDGCDFKCSYCTIPLARGRSRSRPLTDILDEARRFEDAGYKELVLSGIHLGLYGRDLEPQLSVEMLLKALLEVTDTVRFRLSSIEMTEVTDGLVELFNDNRICRHLHLPLQSGDNYILQRMNRHYTVEEYANRLKVFKERISGIGVGCDVIVGFPGETDESFNKTKNLLQDLPISYIHAFPYSRRPNTTAIRMDGHIDEDIKHMRVNMLRSISESKKRAFLRANLDEPLAVITEYGPDGYAAGTTDNYIKVLIDSKYGLQPGMLVSTRIDKIESGVVFAYPVKNP